MEEFYCNGTSFMLKEIMPTYEVFKEKSEQYNYFEEFVSTDEINSKIVYYMLMTNFANAYIRQDTPDLFYADFANIYLSTYGKYVKLFNTIKNVYESKVDILRDEYETTEETLDNTTKTDSSSKTADTPTVVNPDLQFDDSYSNAASSSKLNGNFNQNRKLERIKDYNVVRCLNEAIKLSGYPLKDMAQEYACLFIQIDNPTLDLIYTER